MTIQQLLFWQTDLLVAENVGEWTKTRVVNTTLTQLTLRGVDGDVIENLNTVTKLAMPKLKFY